ncbi:unnamed protein product, partial [Brenthis ino]
MKFCRINLKIILKKFYSTMADSEWKGVPIANIVGSYSPWGAPEFPLVQPAYNHTVLYHIPGSGAQLDRPPKPQIGKDKWDQVHVRMPFSPQNLYPVENSAGETELKKRWEMIQNALNKPIKNSKELASAILSYNTQFKNRWKFLSLHYLFEEYLEEEEAQYFFDVTLPEIAKLALALPKLIQSPIPLLKQHKNRSISLSQQQISSLLANAFFCTFPRRNTTKKDSEYASYPHINFNVLYECMPSEHILEKMKCICHYFRRVCTKVPVGVVTVSRRSVRADDLPRWHECSRTFADLPIHVDSKNTIEEAYGLIQVDFANKFLGGGVLGHGCVQEEIRFVICPELLVTMLFTECLRPTEALMIIGCEQYSAYRGYGTSFRWAGARVDAAPHDAAARRRCAVLALDALPFRDARLQYRADRVARELNKAWVGFSFYTTEDDTIQYPGVATGNWGCGAFNGSASLKSLIQMMALASVGRPMAYYTFGDTQLRDDIIRVYNMFVDHGVKVGQLYGLILKFCESKSQSNIYSFLEKSLQKNRDFLKSESTSCVASTKTETQDLSLKVELELNRSPDLFGPDDDFDLATLEEDTNLKKEASLEDVVVHKMDDTRKMSTSDISTEENNRTNQTSRLFDEMEKLDEDSGNLNLKSPQKSIFGPNSKKSDAAMDIDNKIQTEVTPDAKKKFAKKITDYFSKKPV